MIRRQLRGLQLTDDDTQMILIKRCIDARSTRGLAFPLREDRFGPLAIVLIILLARLNGDQ